jgi:chemotaxis protein CheD
LFGDLDGRYGVEALWLMLRDLVRAGADPSQCEAKIFGGGNMFPEHRSDGNANVGVRNGQTAHALLTELGLHIVSESLFGIGHRNIIFDIASGNVWVRQIKPVALTPPAAQTRMAA